MPRPPDWSASTAPCGGALSELTRLSRLLSTAGFVAPDEEAHELVAAAGDDVGLLDALVERRLTGEPLAWITGRTSFCDVELRVDPGVYVPRWHTEQLARRAVDLLPPAGTAIDLCTGTGAIAKTMLAAHAGGAAGEGTPAREGAAARIVATDMDERAVACARANGVDAYCGDLFAPLPGTLEGRVDLVVAVVPYVPTPALALLQRDTLTFESPLSYDGGPDGTDILRRVLTESPRYLRPGGTVLLELGGGESDALSDDLARLGYVDVTVLLDDDGDIRGLEATWSG
jgi:release factor glutamine methyltransferase